MRFLHWLFKLLLPEVINYTTSSAEETDACRMTLPLPDRILRMIIIVIMIVTANYMVVIMVETWMLCGNGWGLCGRCHGGNMDAQWEGMESLWALSWLGYGCFVWVDDIMVGTWMLSGKGWSLGERYHGWDIDALRKRMGSARTLSWLGHGCSVIVESGWMLSWLGHGCSAS